MSKFIPIMTSREGSCLTAENWTEVGANHLACAMEQLLMKPGLDALMRLPNLKTYLGWEGKLTINASSLCIKEGVIHLSSIYDGQKIRVSWDVLWGLLNVWELDAIVLPQGIDAAFYLANKRQGLWCWVPETSFSKISPISDIGLFQEDNKDFTHYLDVPCYIAGVKDYSRLTQLLSYKNYYVESNAPAAHALEGMIYRKTSMVSLNESVAEKPYQILDAACSCPSCAANLTAIYLEYLLAHTPLLAQRYLIQHNISKIDLLVEDFSL